MTDPTLEAETQRETGPRTWLRRGVLNLALLLGSMLVALAFAEAAVRLLHPQQLILLRPDIWQATDTLGWEHRPHVDTRVNTGERTVRFVTDGEGFRVGPGGRVEADRSILLIGDSFMAALQVEYGQSLAGIMEDSLPPALGAPVAVRNAAVGAWDASHYLLRTRRVLSHGLDPDLVLVAVYVGNDVVADRVESFPPRRPVEREEFRFPSEFSWSEIVDGFARPLNDRLETRSHLFVLLKNNLRGLRIRLGLSAVYIPENVRVDRANQPGWEVTAKILEEVASEAHRAGSEALFLLIPSDYQVYPELYRRHARAFGADTVAVDLAQPNRIMARLLEDRGLTVVDALPPLRQAAEDGAELYGRVDTHLSPAGHATLWSAVRPVLTRLLKESPDASD